MSALKAIGLSQYEEAIYLSLVQLQKADAKKISSHSKVPPTAVYPNLKNLIEKGLVQKLNSETTLFEAINPDIALKTFIDNKKKSFDANLTTALEELKKVPKDTFEQKERVNVSMGKEFSNNMFFEMSQRTTKSIYIMGWKFSHKNDKIKLLKSLKKLIELKKDVRLITPDDKPKSNNTIKEIIKMKIPVRYHPVNNISIVIRDNEETKITLKNKELGEKINLQIEDADLSVAMNDYFLTTWKKAKKI